MFDDRITIDRLLVRAVIGLNEWERQAKQDVLVSAVLFLDLAPTGRADNVLQGVDYGAAARQIMGYVENSERRTIEALATDVAGICLAMPSVQRARVRIAKPAADRFARSISASIERTREQLEQCAYISVGSNSDAEANLISGVGYLRGLGTILGSSMAYQTPAIGGAGPDYLNAVVAVRTCLPAGELRRRLKEFEAQRGRDRSQEKLVSLDLDICLIDEQVVDEGSLQLPHRDLLSRYDLSMMLAEIDPGLRHPVTGELFSAVAARLKSSSVPVPRPDVPLTPKRAARRG